MGAAGTHWLLRHLRPRTQFRPRLAKRRTRDIAIAKFTHSGSQIIDWTPEGSMAKSRHLYPKFIAFINESIDTLRARGHEVELAGVVYHVGENDMSFSPYRKDAPKRLQAIAAQSRTDWSARTFPGSSANNPQPDDERVNKIDVTAELERIAAVDKNLIHIKAFDLPKQEKKLVLDTAGVVRLGEVLAERYLQRDPDEKR